MITRLASAVCALALAISVAAATIHTASAQNQSGAPPVAGLPSPEHVQPALSPPLLSAGPVTLFADFHDLSGGAGLDLLRRMTVPVSASY